jgi:hypothetical protein
MTDSTAHRGEAMICPVLSRDLVLDYARGVLNDVAAWSVEAHVPDCRSCRSVLTGAVDAGRLSHNRSLLLTRQALEDDRRMPRQLSRVIARAADSCGIPPHVWRLLSATPSLRRSWLIGVVLVLGVVVGIAQLATSGLGRGGLDVDASVLPFMLLAPLLPLAGVTVAFHPRFDPSADLAVAAPVSAVWLLCVRSTAVIMAALLPIVLAGLALPDGGWLPLLLVLPALTISILALALATVTGPLPAALISGGAWVAVVGVLGVRTDSAAVVYGSGTQLAWLAAIGAASCLLVLRHHVLDLGWNR